MNAGRELDALVAEKIMGIDLHDSAGRPIPFLMEYSTDIWTAWKVVEKMHDNEQFHAECDDLIGLSRQTARNAARIICIAALQAVGVEMAP
jgi:hypothetical protein